jgi:hypothetical protein
MDGRDVWFAPPKKGDRGALYPTVFSRKPLKTAACVKINPTDFELCDDALISCREATGTNS